MVKRNAKLTPPENPKKIYGDMKVPLGLIPLSAATALALGLYEGKLKYGENNWRASPVETMTYINAAMRHLMKYTEGQDRDPDTMVPELGSVMACYAILMDAACLGTLIDNRKYKGYHSIQTLDQAQIVVKHLQELHGDKDPIHYTLEI